MSRHPFHEPGYESACPRCRTTVVYVDDDLAGFGYGIEPVQPKATEPFWQHTPNGYRRLHAGPDRVTHAVHHCPPPTVCWWCGNTHLNNQ